MSIKEYKKCFIKEYPDAYSIFNCFTGGSAKLEKNKYLSLESLIKENEQNLLKDAVILADEQDNYNLVNFLYDSETKNTEHIIITDALYFQCNLNCIYCMQKNLQHNEIYLSPSERVKLWENVIRLLSAKTFSLCLFGGEPFFDEKYVERLLSLAIEKGLQLSSIDAVTNGTLISENLISMFNKYPFNSLQITIDGPEEIHNSRRISKDNSNTFLRISQNIDRLLRETDLRIIINTVLDKANCKYYLDFIDYAISTWSKDIFSATPRIIFNLGNECDPYLGCEFTERNNLNSVKDIDIYYETLNKLLLKGVSINSFLPSMSCIHDNMREVVIGPDGSLYSCKSAIGVPDFHICSMNEVLHNPVLALTKYLSKKQGIKTIHCNNCSFYGMCNGGCLYEKSTKNLKTACQKPLFSKSIDYIMDMIYISEEITPSIYRIKE